MTTPQTPVDAHMALVSEYAIVVMDDYARGFAPGVKQKQARAAVEASARALAAIPAEPVQKMAPVQGWPQGIPWSLHLEAYAAYCKRWGAQPALIDLEGRNCRGGFGTGELDMFIPGWRDRVSEITALRAENARLRADIGAMVQADADHALAHMQQAGGVPAGTDLVTIRLPTLTPEQAADVSWCLAEALVGAGRMDDGRMLLFVGEAAPSPSAVQPLSEAQREPLTDEQIAEEHLKQYGDFLSEFSAGVRFAERAHGIITKESST